MSYYIKTFTAIIILFCFFLSANFLLAQENGGPYIPDENTVLLMHFDGNAVNSADVGVDGIVHGSGVSYETGIHGQCLRLDNSTADKQSWIEVSFYDELNFTEEFSIECWFKINSWGEFGGNKTLFQKEGIYEAFLFASRDALQANLECENTPDWNWAIDAGVSVDFEPNKWYHLAVYYSYSKNHMHVLIRDENYKELFVSKGHSQTPPVTSEGKLNIGFGGADFTCFDGWIDELRISKKRRKYRDDVLKNVDTSTFKEEVFLQLKDSWGSYQWPLGELFPVNNETGEIFRKNHCGPTMLGRAIHYWEHPRFPSGVIQHNISDCNWYVNFDNEEYLWDLMPDNFPTDVTVEEYTPAATFMMHMGTASRESYDNMSCYPGFLIENCHFSPKTRILQREDYTHEEWVNILKNELNNGRPICAGGVIKETLSGSGAAGHYYVIDGYNKNDEFHTDYSLADNVWDDIDSFDYGYGLNIIAFLEPDWNNKTLEIITPSENSHLKSGTETEIKWVSANINQVILEYSDDAGKTWNVITESTNAGGSYNWTVPNYTSKEYKIRISDTEDLNVNRRTPVFEVFENKQFEFKNPAANSVIYGGKLQPVYWETSGITAFKLEFSADNGSTWMTVQDSVNVHDNLSFYFPETETNEGLLKASDMENEQLVWLSGKFNISNNSVKSFQYNSEEGTELLLHFENNLKNSANNNLYAVEGLSIGEYVDNYALNLGKAFKIDCGPGSPMADFLWIYNSDKLDLGKNWTMETWVNIKSIGDDKTSYNPVVIEKEDVCGIMVDHNYFVAKNGFFAYLNFTNETSINFFQNQPLDFDKWYHVALICDSVYQRVSFYVHNENRELLYSSCQSFPEGSNGILKQNQNTFKIGGLGGASNRYLDGYFDELRIIKKSGLSEYIEYQKLPFKDDFSNNYKNWSTFSADGDDAWHISGDDGIDGGKCARFYPTSNPQQANDDWLISPVFKVYKDSNILISFKYLYSADGVSPDFYYATSFDGNPYNSEWILIDKSFWTKDWGWQDANIKIENNSETFVFAVRYNVKSSDSYYFLMDNLNIKEYKPEPEYVLIGSSNHFEFYSSTDDALSNWNEIKVNIDQWYVELCSYWDRPERESVFSNNNKIKIYLTTRKAIADAVGFDLPGWKYGECILPDKIYLAVPPDDDPIYSGSFSDLTKNILSQLILKKKYQIDGDNNFPQYFTEAFGLFYSGYKPDKEAILNAIADFGGYPVIDDIKSIDGIDTGYKKDLLVSYIEAQSLSRIGIQFLGYNAYERVWQRHFKYFYELEDDECIKLRKQTAHFNLYFAKQDMDYIDAISDKLEEKYEHYTSVFEFEVKHRFNCVIYPSSEAGSYCLVYSDDYNGGSAWSGDNLDFLSPVEFGGGINEALKTLIPHEFFHAFNFNFVNHLFKCAPFNSEGMAELMAYEGENENYLKDYKWYFDEGLKRFAKENGREPNLADIMPDEDNYMSVYTYGHAFWYFMIQNYTDYQTIREFFEKGEDWSVFDVSYDQIDRDYIEYLKGFITSSLQLQVNEIYMSVNKSSSTIILKTCDKNELIKSIELLSPTGQFVLKLNALNNTHAEIQIPNISAVYILKITTNKRVVIKKIY